MDAGLVEIVHVPVSHWYEATKFGYDGEYTEWECGQSCVGVPRSDLDCRESVRVWSRFHPSMLRNVGWQAVVRYHYRRELETLQRDLDGALETFGSLLRDLPSAFHLPEVAQYLANRFDSFDDGPFALMLQMSRTPPVKPGFLMPEAIKHFRPKGGPWFVKMGNRAKPSPKPEEIDNLRRSSKRMEAALDRYPKVYDPITCIMRHSQTQGVVYEAEFRPPAAAPRIVWDAEQAKHDKCVCRYVEADRYFHIFQRGVGTSEAGTHATKATTARNRRRSAKKGVAKKE